MTKKLIFFYILCVIYGLFGSLVYSQCSNPYAGADLSVCGHTCSLEATSVTTGHWVAYNEGGLVFPEYSPSSNNASVEITINEFAGVQSDYLFIWIDGSDVACRDSVLVNFFKQPNTFAGDDVAECGLSYVTEANYSIGDIYYNPTGIWSVLTMPVPTAVAVFADVTENITEVSVNECGVYVFIWTEFNSLFPECNNSDTVQIEFVMIPQVFAGEDQDVCGNCAQFEATSEIEEGLWFYYMGDMIEDINDPNSTVCVGNYGIHTYNWVVVNSALTSGLTCIGQDEVKIMFHRPPTADLLMSEADSVVCGLTFAQLRAESVSSGAVGLWGSSCNNAVFGDVNSNNTDVTVDTYGLFNFYFIESTGTEQNPLLCSDTSEIFTIRFIEVPDSYAGEDELFCGLNGQLNAIASVGSGKWLTPSGTNVHFSDSHDPNTEITSNIYNTGSQNDPYFDMIWTEDNTHGCTDKDTVKIIFARIPVSDFVVYPAKCFGEIFTTQADEDSIGQYVYNFYGGIIDSVPPPNAAGGINEMFVHWEDGELTHRISMQTINYWGCQSDTTENIAVEPPIPEFGLSSVPDVCARGVGKVLCNPEEDCTIKWFEGNIGPPIYTEVSQVAGLLPGSYNLIAQYMTSNMTYYTFYIEAFGTPYCFDTLTVEVENSILFELRCPDDIVLTEQGEILLYQAFPQDGIYTYNGQEINSFDPVSYGNGTYEIVYNYFDVDTDCLGECQFNIIVDLPNFVEDADYSEISILPNPNSGSFHLSYGGFVDDLSYEIYDIKGNLIQSGKAGQSNCNDMISVNVSSGIYFIKLQIPEGIITKKLVID